MTREGSLSKRAGVALVFLAIAVVSGLAYAMVPPSPDQLELDYTAWRALAGETQYVDLVAMNWPGAHWLHSLAMALFGNNLHAWRIFDYLIMLVALGALAHMLWRAFNPAAALAALATYPVIHYAGEWLTGQRDFVGSHFLLIAAWFHWRRRPVATGLVVAAATVIKPTLLLAAAIFALHGLWSAKRSGKNGWARGGVRDALRLGAAVTGGVALAFLALWLEGVPLSKFVESAITLHRDAYDGRSSRLELVSSLFQHVAGPWWWVALGALGSTLWFVGPRPRGVHSVEVYALLLVLPVVSLVSYFVQGKGFQYHLAGLYIGMCATLFVGVGAMVETLKRGPRPLRIAAVVFLIFMAVAVAARFKRMYVPALAFLMDRTPRAQYYRRHWAGEMTYTAAERFVRHIDRAVEGPGSILVWSRANIINNATGYPQSTRFHHPPVLNSAKPPFQPTEAWRAAFIADVKAESPLACVLCDEQLNKAHPSTRRFLHRYVAKRYEEVDRAEQCVLYLRRDLHARGPVR